MTLLWSSQLKSVNYATGPNQSSGRCDNLMACSGLIDIFFLSPIIWKWTIPQNSPKLTRSLIFLYRKLKDQVGLSFRKIQLSFGNTAIKREKKYFHLILQVKPLFQHSPSTFESSPKTLTSPDLLMSPDLEMTSFECKEKRLDFT